MEYILSFTENNEGFEHRVYTRKFYVSLPRNCLMTIIILTNSIQSLVHCSEIQRIIKIRKHSWNHVYVTF